MLIIRPEIPADIPIIRRINELAFGQPDEAALVERLRAAGKATLSLVAVKDSLIIGHILFSPVEIVEGEMRHPAVGLAPMAVHPDYQKRGVGSALIYEGLEGLRRLHHGIVVVLGHPDYYPRFDFVPSSRFGVDSTYKVPEEVFMMQELEPGAWTGESGTVHYASEFGGL